ncbi:MAG: WD40 repeat domain-containing protein, partial [Longimicrobiales bacterium]
AASLAMAMLLMIIGLTSSSMLYVQARDGQAQAVRSKGQAMRESYVANVLAADFSLSSGRIPEAKLYLSECLEELRGWEWYHLLLRTDGSIAPAAIHESSLTCVAYSPDGALVACGSESGGLSLCDALTGEVRFVVQGHSGAVLAVAFSRDGTRVSSIGNWDDGMLRHWDARSGIPLGERDLRVDPSCAAFDPVSGAIALARDDNTIEVFDPDTPERRRFLEGHADLIHSLDFSLDGKQLLSGSADGAVLLWDLAGDGTPRVLREFGLGVRCVAIHPQGLRYAAGLEDGRILRWEGTGGELPDLVGHRDLVYDLEFSPDGASLASGSFDKSVRVWDAITGEPAAILWGHDDAVRTLAFHPAGKRLASGSQDTSLRIWNGSGHGEVRVWNGSQESIGGVRFSPDGEHVLVGSAWEATVSVVDVVSGESVVPFDEGSNPEDGITSVAFGPRGECVAASLDEGAAIWLWDHPSGKLRAELRGHLETVTSLAFSADGETLISGSWDGTVRSWSTRGGASRILQHVDGQAVNAVSISTEGLVASGWDDGVIRLWDLPLGAERDALLVASAAGGFDEMVHDLAFGPGGQQLACASGRNRIRIWDLRTGQFIELPKGHDQRVTALAFSQDGQRLVSGSHDHTVSLWDVHDPGEARQLLTLRGHSDFVTSVDISLDGRRIVSSSSDNTVRIWSAPDRTERARED